MDVPGDSSAAAAKAAQEEVVVPMPRATTASGKGQGAPQGSTQPSTLAASNYRAGMLKDMGKHAEAEPNLKICRTLQAREETLVIFSQGKAAG